MLGNGNGNPMNCVSNLLRIVRGECPYDRIKGMDPTLEDMNSSAAVPLMAAEARWLIQTYEPRVDVSTIDINSILAKTGGFAINVNATEITE